MENLKIVKTLAELRNLKAYLADQEYVAFDVETTGLTKDHEIIGFSVCADPTLAYYVILAYWDVPTQKLVYLETKDEAHLLFQDLKAKKLIMHNGPYDCMMVESNYKISLIDSLHTDTLVSGHLLNENRSNGLKERGIALYGLSASQEQAAMKASVQKNGGLLTKEHYELYKADADLIAYYGAKDAILTLKVFYEDVASLHQEGLDGFFYDDESMPLLRGPTYQLNTTGLRVDPVALQKLKVELETFCMETKALILQEIDAHVKDKYPGTGKTNHFNIGASKQLAWLLFIELGNEFHTLTKGGRELCKALDMKLPYTYAARRNFIEVVTARKGEIWKQAGYNRKTKKRTRPSRIGDVWNYMACGKESLTRLAPKYKWVELLLTYAKNLKLLNTYVIGIQERATYNIIRPSFLQHGTTSGRYACRAPNFQNLPRKDKRVKKCIISRPGKVFVGADYAQLEPRVFASVSQDPRLLACFKSGDDFYSVIGAEVFDKTGCSLVKEGPNTFATLYPDLRDISKVVALSTTYGTTAPKMAPTIGKSMEETQEVIDNYLTRFDGVKRMMDESHDQAMTNGVVHNLYGRPRRMSAAKDIRKLYGNAKHRDLPYEYRNLLNLAVNHRIQSTAASIMNRAAILFHTLVREQALLDPRWLEVKIVLQVHDELIAESPEAIAEDVKVILKYAMEHAVELPGVQLLADPKIANNLADLK